MVDTRLPRIPLSSTAVRTVGYDEERQELVVEYSSGHTYSYQPVPLAVYQWLLKVPNKGRYLRTHIVGHYAEQRLVPSLPSEVSLEDQLRGSLVQAQQPHGSPRSTTDD